jgi:hypothetical protein
MTARETFQAMVKAHVRPPLRNAGFKSSALTWRLQSSDGDFVLVNLQQSRRDSGDAVRFYVNLAVVPASWWEFVVQNWGKTPLAPTESYGLLRRHLDPPNDHPTSGQG